jgi:hypothetical protein
LNYKFKNRKVPWKSVGDLILKRTKVSHMGGIMWGRGSLLKIQLEAA